MTQELLFWRHAQAQMTVTAGEEDSFGFLYTRNEKKDIESCSSRQWFACHYTGREVCPELYIYDPDTSKRLTEGVDYQVTFENNVEIGTAWAGVQGIGAYSGLLDVYFNIIENNTGNEDNKNEDNKEDDTIPSPMPVPVSGIRISGISHNIAAGKKIALKAEISPANAQDTRLIWSSSNPKVATVNTNGVVTMKKGSGGKKVTIKAAAADGSGVFASYRITSMKGVVKKISISGKKTVKAGKSIKLKTKVSATKKANKTLLWSSSNEKLATVKNGKVTEKKNAKGKKLGSQPLPQTAAEKRKPSPSRFSDPSTLI